jgi:hypothetical protein
MIRPGELVDDLDLAVLDHVVDVALVERLGLERLDQVVDELDVARVVEVLDPSARSTLSIAVCAGETVLCFSS